MVTKLVNEVTDGRSDLCRTGKKKKKNVRKGDQTDICAAQEADVSVQLKN